MLCGHKAKDINGLEETSVQKKVGVFDLPSKDRENPISLFHCECLGC